MNISVDFTLEKYMTCYIAKKRQPFFLISCFNHASKRKGLKNIYFALISLETDSSLNFFKDTYDRSYIEIIFFATNAQMIDSES